MHNFPNHIYVTVKNVTLTQAKTILKLCIDAKLPFNEDMILNPVDSEYCHYFYDYNEKNYISQSDKIADKDDIVVSFTEFCNYIKGKGKIIKPPYKKEIVLNSSYKAVITSQKVEVGCQTFSHEVIKSLYEAVIESQK